jgi:hypothetical protein
MSAPVPPSPTQSLPEAEEPPGVPGLRTWRRVYVAVVVVFIGNLIVLAALGRLFG